MATYYISPTGNDSTGNGTSGNPWLTVSKAHTSSTIGDTIFCLSGTYSMVTQGFTGRTVTCATVGSAIFDAATAKRIWSSDSGTTNIINIAFQNVGATDNTCNFIAGSNATLNITNCTFTHFVGASSSGIFGFTNGPTNPTLNVIGCLINDFTGDGSYNYAGIMGTPSAATTSGTMNFFNNTVYLTNSSQSYGIITWRGSGGGNNFVQSLKNNIFYSVYSRTFYASFGTSTNPGLTGSNNLCYQVTSAPAAIGTVLTSDPLFIDAANGNFNLRPTSPCIDAGVVI